MSTAILTHDEIRKAAPSAFQSTAWGKMSDRYRVIPTVAVIDMLSELGWKPTRASQSGSRIEGKAEFTRHSIRLRHEFNLITVGKEVGTHIPEIVLTNAHDGTSAYQLDAGIYRVVCRNGMVVSDCDLQTARIRHSGKDEASFREQVIDVTCQVVSELPKVMDRIETYRQIQLPAPIVQKFAEVVGGEDIRDLPEGIKPTELLRRRRIEDQGSDLWTVANVIQENAIQGGARGYKPGTFKRVKARPVKSVSEDLRINRAIWQITDAIARQMGG